MLDIIRKKARSWGTRIIFAIIILVFAVFFGYNSMTKGSRGSSGGSLVATVNGDSITRPEYNMAYENNLKLYQQIFKTKEGEPLPEGMEKNARISALKQMIQQKVMEKLGRRLGIEAPPAEIADLIRNLPMAKGEDGHFDPYLYKQRFLPYFAQKYKIDYEYLLASDATMQNARGVFTSSAKAPLADKLYELQNTKWTFDVTEFNSEADALSNKNGKTKKLLPVTVAERGNIFPQNVGLETWESIFSLSAKKPTLPKPIKAGEKWYTIKFVKVTTPLQWVHESNEFTGTLAKKNEEEFTNSWISSLLKDAKVKTYIKE